MIDRHASSLLILSAALVWAADLTGASPTLTTASPTEVERWGRYEVVLKAPVSGNPFTDSTFRADFQFEHRTVTVDGFYDGDGTWRVRFMPDTIGEWSYVTHSPTPALNGVTGRFRCVSPSAGNHGPVSVS